MTGKAGSILILALWTLFFLGALALAVGAHVSANLKLAGSLKASTTAYYLARAGVEKAIMEVVCNPTNWESSAEDSLKSAEGIFKDNRALDGGTFSVIYTFVSTDSGRIVTNYGVISEARRININKTRSEKNLETLLSVLGVADSSGISKRIIGWPAEKKKLAEEAGNRYSRYRFESLRELLMVKGVTHELFVRVEPFLTVYGRRCFGGMAVGRASGSETEDRRIAFVCNRNGEKVYWHEY